MLLTPQESKAENVRDVAFIEDFVLLAVVEPKKSFLDDLYGFGGDDVEALFNGISDSPVFSDNQGKRKGTVSKISFCFLFSVLDIPIALNLVCKLGFETYFNQLVICTCFQRLPGYASFVFKDLWNAIYFHSKTFSLIWSLVV